MKKILIPTDFSSVASNAYNVAAELARKNNATILLFHITESHFQNLLNLSYPFTDKELIDVAQKEDAEEKVVAEAKLKDLVNNEMFNGVNVETEIFSIDQENVYESIVKKINAKDHSLMVMGTEGVDKDGQTVAQLVARYATIPVISIKNKIETPIIQQITLCTDFKNISRRFTHLLGALANNLGATISLLYVNTPRHFMETSEIITEFKRFKRMYDLPNIELSIYDAYKVENGILTYLEKSNTDMLAISTHGRTGLSYYLLGSHTDDIINKASVPVYSYNLHDFNEGQIHYEGGYSAYTGGFVG